MCNVTLFFRTSARPSIPQGNLKDRIAALQQRNVSASHPHDNHPPPSLTAVPRIGTGATVGSLREKIASFEKKGAVPTPRGSFGIGAPPVDDGSSRRKGELYGNRVPGLSKPIAVPLELPGLPNSRRRTVSSSVYLNSSPRPSRPASPTLPESRSDSLSDAGDSPSPSRSQRRFSTFGELSPGLPFSISPSKRRSVSDVPPQILLSHRALPEPPLPETEEEISHEVRDECTAEKPNSSKPLLDQPHHSGSGEISAPSDPPSFVVSPDPSPALDGEPHSMTPPADVEQLASPPSPVPSVDISENLTQSETPVPITTPDLPQSEPELNYTPLDGPVVGDTSSGTPVEEANSPQITASDVESPALQSNSPAGTVHIDCDNSPAVPEVPANELASSINTESIEDSSPHVVTPPSEYHSPLEEVKGSLSSPLSGAASPSPPDGDSVSSGTVLTPEDALFASAQTSPSSKLPFVEQSPEPNETEDPITLDQSFVQLAAPVLALESDHAIVISEPPTIIAAPSPVASETPAVTIQADETPLAPRPLSPVSDHVDESFNTEVETSLALDTKDAVILSVSPQIVSPTVSRGTLVPAPTPKTLAPPPVPEVLPSPALIPPEVSPSANAMVRSKSARRTFHAVVHDKVREAGGEPVPKAPSVTPSTAKAPRAQPYYPDPLPDVISPGIGELASLVADAALLEAQLSSLGSPNKRPMFSPLVIQTEGPVPEPTTPTPTRLERERRRPTQDIPDAVGEGEHDQAIEEEEQLVFQEPGPLHLALPPKRSTSLTSKSVPTPTLTEHPPLPLPQVQTTPYIQEHYFPGTPYRQDHTIPPTINEVGPPPLPPKLSSTSHSVIRRSPSGRKPSMPGAYPRGSYSSEDSSLVTSNPSSPGSHDHESLRSDSSSVKSSSKSLKGPMKGLSRAGSFAERFWNRGKKKKSVNGGRSQVFELLNVFVSDTVIFRR